MTGTLPIILEIAPRLHAAMHPHPNGSFVLSVYDEPTGRELWGVERSYEDALGWLRGAELVLRDPEGRA